MSQCPRASNLSDQPYYTAIIFWNLRIDRPVLWVRRTDLLAYVIWHGDASNKLCPHFADQLFGAYLGSVLGLAAEIVRGTIHLSHEKENFDAPEVASIGRAARMSHPRGRVRTSHPYYGARTSIPARPRKNTPCFSFLVALPPVRDLLLRAKHLFVAAILAGPPASHPISQGTGHHRAAGPRQARTMLGCQDDDDLLTTLVLRRSSATVAGPSRCLCRCRSRAAHVRRAIAPAQPFARQFHRGRRGRSQSTAHARRTGRTTAIFASKYAPALSKRRHLGHTIASISLPLSSPCSSSAMATVVIRARWTSTSHAASRLRIGHGDPSNKLCPNFALQLFAERSELAIVGQFQLWLPRRAS